jgi:hypothetical protein
VATLGAALAVAAGCSTSEPGAANARPGAPSTHAGVASTTPTTTVATSTPAGAPASALGVLATLPVKGRAPKTGYSREQFGTRWADVDRNGCDTRNDILNRDLAARTWRPGTNGCVVISGTLQEPYTGTAITFAKERAVEVQIDHVVALSNAWQTGAQQLDPATRRALANDPLGLLAVDGRTNQQKGDGDAATWLPPNRSFWCPYVARQVAVKAKYRLWATPAEHAAIARVLERCPDEPVPVG